MVHGMETMSLGEDGRWRKSIQCAGYGVETRTHLQRKHRPSQLRCLLQLALSTSAIPDRRQFRHDGRYCRDAHSKSRRDTSFAPCTPKCLETRGCVRGVRAEGGFEIDLEWDSEQVQASIHSLAGQPCRLQTKDGEQCEVYDASNDLIACNDGKAKILTFDTAVGETYSVKSVIDTSSGNAIHDIAEEAAHRTSDGAWYDLSGRKVHRTSKGIYIHDGHKVVIK